MSRVLVVDDDDDIRDLVTLRLEMDGHAVIAIGDPVEALARAATTRLDLAILDWTMPDMDGGELCTRLRELPHLGGTPVLIVTAHADPRTRDLAFAAGASGYIAKPFSLLQLSEAVRDLLVPTT